LLPGGAAVAGARRPRRFSWRRDGGPDRVLTPDLGSFLHFC
jgi:hypothetical protein